MPVRQKLFLHFWKVKSFKFEILKFELSGIKIFVRALMSAGNWAKFPGKMEISEVCGQNIM